MGVPASLFLESGDPLLAEVFSPEEAGLLAGAELTGLADDVEVEAERAAFELLAVTVCGCTSQWNGSKLELGSTQDGFLAA